MCLVWRPRSDKQEGVWGLRPQAGLGGSPTFCPNRNPAPIRRGDRENAVEKRGKSVRAKHVAEHQKRPRIVGRFCLLPAETETRADG